MESIVRQRLKVFLLSMAGTIVLLEISLRILGLFYSLKSRQDKPDPRSGYSILCVGDSFVFGCGAPFGKSFPEQLEALLNSHKPAKIYSVINRGIPTQNTTQLLDNLDDYIEIVRPDVIVVLSGGANNWNFEGYQAYLKGKSLWTMPRNYLYRVRIFKLIKLLAMRLKEASERKRNIAPELFDNKAFFSDIKDAPIDMMSPDRIPGTLSEYAENSAMDMDGQGLKADIYRADAYAALGYVNLNGGDVKYAIKLFGSAEKIYKKAIEAAPEDAYNYVRLAYLNLYAHRVIEAKELFHEAISKSAPRNKLVTENDEVAAGEIDGSSKIAMNFLSIADSYTGLGYISAAEQEDDKEALRWYDAAQETYEKAIQYDSGNGHVYMGLAYLNLYRGHIARAYELFVKAEELCKKTIKEFQPSDEYAYLLLAYIYIGQGNFKEAKNTLLARALVQPYDGLSADFSVEPVNINSEMRKSENTSSLDNLSRLGYLSLMRGNLKEASKYFKSAMDGSQKDDRSHDAMGTINQLQHNYHEALKWYKKAIALNPTEVRYYAHISNTYEQMGNFKEAVDFFESSRRYIGKTADDFILMFKRGNGRLGKIEEWIKSDLERIVVACHKEGVRVILQTYPGGYFEHGDIVKQIARSHFVPVVDNLKIFADLGANRDRFFSEDGHCNSLGYDIMAKNIYGVMLQEKIIALKGDSAVFLR